MPRLSPRLIREAQRLHPLLPLTLSATRDLPSAQNELRWLKHHAIQNASHTASATSKDVNRSWRRELRRLCVRRSQGEPLQYLLGTEFFGDLEISCEPGVLIPR